MVRSCTIFIIAMLVCICKVNAQQYYLFHSDVDKSCKEIDVYYLYSSIDNKIVVRTNGGVSKAKDVLIVSDSAGIKKINDSLYLVRPLYRDVYIKLFIVDKHSKQKIDSVKSFCLGSPFSFSVNTKKIDPHFSKTIIRDMRVLYLEPIRQGCLRYASNFTIISYELILKRNDSVILATSFFGNQQVGNSFKKKLNEVSETGDGLFARNIILKGKDGRKIKIEEYGLLRIQ